MVEKIGSHIVQKLCLITKLKVLWCCAQFAYFQCIILVPVFLD